MEADAMNWKISAVVIAVVAAGAFAAAAEAAARKPVGTQQAAPTQRTIYRYTDENGRRRTKIIVQRRSFLDAGTTVLPGQRKYRDYVEPPFRDPFDMFGPGRGAYERNPIGPRWEFGGVGY
jgi:hypothetical protein